MFHLTACLILCNEILHIYPPKKFAAFAKMCAFRGKVRFNFTSSHILTEKKKIVRTSDFSPAVNRVCLLWFLILGHGLLVETSYLQLHFLPRVKLRFRHRHQSQTGSSVVCVSWAPCRYPTNPARVCRYEPANYERNPTNSWPGTLCQNHPHRPVKTQGQTEALVDEANHSAVI